MRGSVRAASERRNARVKQAAVCLSNKVTFPAHIGRPLRIRRRPGIVTRIFAGVHMLSHVVGTVNRTDIRRLQQLEADNAALSARGSAGNVSCTKALSSVTEHSAAE